MAHNVSDQAVAAFARSHQVETVVEVLRKNGSVALTLPATDGYVRIDRTAEHRRSIDVTVADPDGDLVPEAEDHPLAPFGNRIRAARGVVLADGEPLTVNIAEGDWQDREGFTVDGGLALDLGGGS